MLVCVCVCITYCLFVVLGMLLVCVYVCACVCVCVCVCDRYDCAFVQVNVPPASNECLTGNPCSPDAVCTPDPAGAAICVCNVNKIGDGRTCKGMCVLYVLL